MRLSRIWLPLAATLVACDTSTDAFTSAPTRALTSASSTSFDLPIYGLGGYRRATPQSPCSDGHFRDFDFWVGDWRVFNVAGAFVATNHIVTALDGCVVEENWAPLFGLRGRSLSSYDAELRMWRQTWVPENASGNRPLRLIGSLQASGVMEMSGVRHFWANPAVAYFDTIRWTPIDGDHVVQSTSLDIPIAHLHFAGAPHYQRATAPLPQTSSPGSTNCMAGGDAAESRNLDFLVGNWSLTAANGQPVGSSDIVIDPTLSGCLIEESFSTPKGYRAISWLYYDAIENTYFRTYVDSEGERVELRGTFSDGVLTLTGAEPIRGAEGAQVQVTWSKTSDNSLQQLWQTSTDGGQSWRVAQNISFRKH